MNRPGFPRLTVLLIIGTLAVSCGSVFARLAAAPALVVAAFRVFWATVLFTPPLARGPVGELRRLAPSDWGRLALSGCALACHFALWIASLSHTSVASSVVLVDTVPFFAGIASGWFLGEAPRRSFWIGLAVAFAGCIVIFQGDWAISQDSMKGNALAVCGAAAMAVYLLIGARARRSLSLLAYVWPVYGSAAAALFAACLLAGVPVSGYPARSHLFFFLLGLVPQCIGHTTYNWSLRWIPPAVVGIIGLGEPVGASLLAWIILGEGLTWLKVLGGGIILAGIYVATKPSASPQRN